MGYGGGTTKNPTYYQLGDHTEALQLDYDPNLVSYKELLDTFWAGHNPTGFPYSRQYMSIIFYHEAWQKQEALASKAQAEEALGQKVKTLIAPLDTLYLAEDYHQKYYLQTSKSYYAEIRAYYDTFEGFVNSTAAARINGLLGGYINPTLVSEELRQYGLSDPALESLKWHLK